LEERIVDIKLAKGPSMTNCKCKDNSNSHRFNNWTECFRVVTTMALMKSFGD